MHGHTYTKSMDQPGKVASPARGQLNRENNISLSAFVPENLVSRDGFGSPVPCQPAHLHTLAESGALFVFSSYTYNRRSYIWDYVEPREAFCYFLRIVSPNGCLVLSLSVTPFFSFPLRFSPLFSFLLLSSFGRW